MKAAKRTKTFFVKDKSLIPIRPSIMKVSNECQIHVKKEEYEFNYQRFMNRVLAEKTKMRSPKIKKAQV